MRWTHYCTLLLLLLSLGAKTVNSGVYEGLSINTQIAQDIIRQSKSAGMQSIMNVSINPCDEFYGYACGNYAKINPLGEMISKDFSSTLSAGYQRWVRQLLKKPKISTDSPTETKVKYFYESCEFAAQNLWNQRTHLMALMKEFGGFPALEGRAWNESQFDAIEMMATLLKRFGKVTLLNVRVAPSLANSQINRLYLGQRDDLKSENRNFISLEKQLCKFFGFNETFAKRTASEIGRLHKQLALDTAEPAERLSPGIMNRLRMLSDMTESYGPNLNLTRFVRIWLNHDYQLPVYEYGESYLWSVKKILIKTPKRELANYMLSSLLEDFDMMPCGQKTAELFPDFVDHMVYRGLEKHNPHIPGSMRQLWQELKESFAHILQESSKNYLDESTLEEARTKLKSMTFHIRGAETQIFDNYYENLIISTSDYFGNVQRVLEMRGQHLREDLQRAPNPNNYIVPQVKPFYAMDFNRVIIPASYMQHRYLFDDVYPTAIKYGSLGFLLAQQMGHGFDDVSRSFDAQGNLRNWWQPNATQQFEHRKQCLINQFWNISQNNSDLPKLKLQAQNIADNVGVRIAYGAYLNWLRQQPEMDKNSTADGGSKSQSDPEILPKLSLKSEQLFFLALGQMSCTHLSKVGRNALALNEEPEVRIDAIMRNFDGFAAAFGCSAGANMNPIEKCTIY